MKIGRDAFLYLEPKGSGDDFAQCATCRDYDAKQRRCAILGPAREIDPTQSCGAYIPGRFDGHSLRNLTTPAAVGLVERKVRCENCRFGGERCALYLLLNAVAPAIFELDEKIQPKACCNAQQPKGD